MRTTMSRSVRDWNVPPFPRSNTPWSIWRASPRIGLETIVGAVEELLLSLQIGMVRHIAPFSPARQGNGSA